MAQGTYVGCAMTFVVAILSKKIEVELFPNGGFGGFGREDIVTISPDFLPVKRGAENCDPAGRGVVVMIKGK